MSIGAVGSWTVRRDTAAWNACDSAWAVSVMQPTITARIMWRKGSLFRSRCGQRKRNILNSAAPVALCSARPALPPTDAPELVDKSAGGFVVIHLDNDDKLSFGLIALHHLMGPRYVAQAEYAGWARAIYAACRKIHDLLHGHV